MAQALVKFMSAQHSERDGHRQPFFAGMFGIFGHGNVAGVGQALDQMQANKEPLVVREYADYLNVILVSDNGRHKPRFGS
jgi:3D-(3,5/4)-trihydroxycyclohexane-1,2-dione acylhydrolase (decyclizing)